MKRVATTLRKLAVSDEVRRVTDRATPVDDLVRALLDHWSYDLYARRPGPALTADDGSLSPTDFDLACFLSALVDRRAVVNLPSYVSRRAPTFREGERVTSKQNRHGQVIGTSANKECFSFSVRVVDANVIQAGARDGSTPDRVGAPRNFMLVDVDGQWYDGWKSIEFVPTDHENDFLTDHKLWTGSTVYFDHFVHPNRWVSLFGQYYLLTKLLCDRLTEEAAHLNVEVKRLLAEGAEYPKGDDAPTEWPASERGDSVPLSVDAFEVEVDSPLPTTGKYRRLQADDLVEATKARRRIVYTDLPRLRFATRATELSFYNRALSGTNLIPDHRAFLKRAYHFDPAHAGFPGWVQGAGWTSDYVQHGKRTRWHRLVLAQAFHGVVGLAIRCRQWEKTERVAP